MRYLTGLLLLVVLCSCKMEGSASAGQQGLEGGISLGQIGFAGKRNFTGAEMTIGRLICNALDAKENYLRNTIVYDNVLRANLSGEYKLCGGTTIFNQVDYGFSILIDNKIVPEFYSNANNFYFKMVVSKNDEVFGNFCRNILAATTTENYFENSNMKVGLSFKKNGSTSIAEWVKLEKNANNNFVVTESNSVSFYTAENTPSSAYLGFEKKRFGYTKCQEIEDVKYLSKTLNSLELIP